MRLPSKIGNYKMPPFTLLMMEHAQLTESLSDCLLRADIAKKDGQTLIYEMWLHEAKLDGQEAQQVWKEARKESRHER